MKITHKILVFQYSYGIIFNYQRGLLTTGSNLPIIKIKPLNFINLPPPLSLCPFEVALLYPSSCALF